MRGRRAAALAPVLALLVAAGGAVGDPPTRDPAARGVRAGSSTRPIPAGDPVEAAFAEAIAPGLADSTQARLTRFLAAYGRHPRARDAHYELGLLAYARGDYAIARTEFRRARGPGGGEEARYWDALSAFAIGRPADARNLAQPLARARVGAPRRRDAAYLVALTWAQEGKRAEALAAYRDLFALTPGPGEASALYQAANLARELGRTEDAAIWREKLLREAPQSPEAASLLAEKKAAPAARPDSTAVRERRAP